MIARLAGRVVEIGEQHLVLDVHGVGYLVFTPARLLANLRIGDEAVLLIETHVREDHIHLYGFAERTERELFRMLTAVSGVGAKLALALLSVMDAPDLQLAIAAGDRKALTRASGVGGKLAQRIVNELADRLGTLAGGSAMPGAAVGAPGNGPARTTEGGESKGGREVLVGDAASALVNLGYGRSEALRAVMNVAQREMAPTSLAELIREGLKELSA